MTRPKRARKNANQVIILEPEGPTRHERLADPDSYENRKKRALKAKKKKPSVYQKQVEAEKKAKESENRAPRGGRLADKIRKLAEQKAKQEAKQAAKAAAAEAKTSKNDAE